MSINVTERSRALRQLSTDAEKLVWSKLRNKQFHGLKFRRQRPVGPYIADFCCDEEKLIIELDGGQHTPEKDADRTVFLESQGYKVWRYWNNDVLKNIEGIFLDMESKLPLTFPSTTGLSLSHKGRGI